MVLARASVQRVMACHRVQTLTIAMTHGLFSNLSRPEAPAFRPLQALLAHPLSSARHRAGKDEGHGVWASPGAFGQRMTLPRGVRRLVEGQGEADAGTRTRLVYNRRLEVNGDAAWELGMASVWYEGWDRDEGGM